MARFQKNLIFISISLIFIFLFSSTKIYTEMFFHKLNNLATGDRKTLGWV